MSEDIFRGYGVGITLIEEEDFNIIRETLSRIGIASYKNKTLVQSCHIFHKQGLYRIMHFKEMLAYDGKRPDIPEEDIARRNTIVALLEEWELIDVEDKSLIETPRAQMNEIKVLNAKEKSSWTLTSKYTIGRKQ